MNNLEPHVEVLYKTYHQFTPDAPLMNEFTGFRLSELYSVEKKFTLIYNVYEIISDKVVSFNSSVTL